MTFWDLQKSQNLNEFNPMEFRMYSYLVILFEQLHLHCMQHLLHGITSLLPLNDNGFTCCAHFRWPVWRHRNLIIVWSAAATTNNRVFVWTEDRGSVWHTNVRHSINCVWSRIWYRKYFVWTEFLWTDGKLLYSPFSISPILGFPVIPDNQTLFRFRHKIITLLCSKM